MVDVKHVHIVLDLVENYNFDISATVKDLKLKFYQLKVLELVGLHKFDINFIIIEVHLKKI
jgi:hypothetical protein